MLNLGWVADLFPKEDVDTMVNTLRNEAKSALGTNNPTAD